MQLIWNDLVKTVISTNVDIKLAMLDYKIAKAEAEAGLLDFETLLTLRPEYRHENQLSNSTLESPSYIDKTGSLSVGLKKKFSTGLVGEAVLQEMWLASDSIQSTFSTRDQMAFQLKVTQPLLKGLGASFNEMTLRKARLKAIRYRWELISTVNASLVKAASLYLDLIHSKSERGIKESDVEFYRIKSAEAQRKKQLGILTPPDALAIEAQLQVAQAEFLLAESKLEDVRDKLTRETQSSTLSQLTLISEEEILKIADFNREQLSPSHSKIEIARQQSRETQVDLNKAERSLQPQLDLGFQVSTLGAGTNHPDAQTGLTSLRTPSWQVMFTFSWPFDNQVAKGEFDRLSKESKTRSLFMSKVTLDLKKQHSDNLRDLGLARNALASAQHRLSVANTIASFKADKFSFGKLTPSELIQARNEANATRLEALATAIKLRKNLIKSRELSQSLVSKALMNQLLGI